MTAEEIMSIAGERSRVIAIDGRSAAGKTTLASSIASLTGGSVIHMDDFFLPPELRSAERYSEPGGNIHRERFMAEVIPQLQSGGIVRYRRFDCAAMDYAAEIAAIDASRLVIVEGAYSLHPFFGRYYDFSVFMDIDPSEQMRRIEKRNGKEKAEIFRSRWIPLEEEYIAACGIMEKADICCQEKGVSIPS